MGAGRPRRGGRCTRATSRPRAPQLESSSPRASRPASPPGPRSPCSTPDRSWPTTTTPRRSSTRGLRADLSAWPLYRARLLLNYGRWLRRQRRAADSRAPLRSAREAFDALGARAFAEQARAELRAAGERSQGPETRAWQTSRRRSCRSPSWRRRGAVEPGDRCAPLPLAPHRRLAPLPGLPQAGHHLARPAPDRVWTSAPDSSDDTCKCSRLTHSPCATGTQRCPWTEPRGPADGAPMMR